MRFRTVLFRVVVICLTVTGGIDTVAPGADEPVGPTRGQGRPQDPYPLDLAFSRRRAFPDYNPLGKAVVSPDGTHLAYGVVTPAKHDWGQWTFRSGLPVVFLGARVYVAAIATGEAVALGAPGTTSFTPAWSPDGTKLAYYSDEGGTLRAWVWDAARGAAALAADVRIKVHLNSTTAMPPTWSPDGRHLLVSTLPADEADADPRPPRGTAATGKGRHRPGPGVLVLSSGTEPAPAAEVRTETYGIHDSQVDLTAIDLGAGTTRVLLPARQPGRSGPAFACYSPSGRYLAYVSCLRPGRAAAGVVEDVLDLGVVKVGEIEPLYVEEISHRYVGYEGHSGDYLGRSGVVLAWHPTDDVLLFLNNQRLRKLDYAEGSNPRPVTLAADGGRLSGDYLAFVPARRAALIGMLPADADADSHRLGALGLVPLDGGPARKLPLAGGFDAGQVIRRDGAALWQPVADTATFLVSDQHGARTLVRRLDLTAGEWTTLRSEPASVEFHGMPRDASFLVATVQSYARPADFYRLGTDLATRGRLSTVEPRLDGRQLGPVETFETVVPLHDGRLKTVRTAVLLPPGARRGDRLPALVECYGGRSYSRWISQYGGGFVGSIPAPVFTTRGYAVLLPDAPLGPEGRPGQPAEELRDVILPQVYRAAELGYVDIERVAVTGQSYGGYCTAALIASTNLFRAAVAISGIYDLAGNYGYLQPGDNWAIEWSETGQLRMGQPPWSDLRRYLDNSPYHRADRIHTPLLIIHGSEDSSCPVKEAEMMFSALRRLGRTAQLAVYEGEGHAIVEWDAQRAVDATDRVLDFLRRQLSSGRADPIVPGPVR